MAAYIPMMKVFFINNNFIHKLETGKIEVHDLKDNHQTQCEPVKDH